MATTNRFFDGDKQTVYNHSKTPRVMAMTLCVAALCENKQAIVCVADRLLTTTYPDKTEIEHEGAEKIKEPMTYFSVSCCGDTSVFGRLNNMIMAKLVDECKINPYYSPNIEDVVPIVGDMFNKLTKGGTDTSETFVILAGYDYSGGHIYEIGAAGSRCNDHAGFIAVGIGRNKADKRFKEMGHAADDFLLSTIQKAYIAKRASESVKGVGKKTDILVNIKGVQKKIRDGDEIISLLNQYYLERKDGEDNSEINIKYQELLRGHIERLFNL